MSARVEWVQGRAPIGAVWGLCKPPSLVVSYVLTLPAKCEKWRSGFVDIEVAPFFLWFMAHSFFSLQPWRCSVCVS